MIKYTKYPLEVENWTISWTSRLAVGQSIDTIELTVPAGITAVDVSNTTTTNVVRISGGTAGTTYHILIRALLTDGVTELNHCLVIEVEGCS